MFFIKIKRVTFRISGSYTLRTGLYHKTQFSNSQSLHNNFNYKC